MWFYPCTMFASFFVLSLQQENEGQEITFRDPLLFNVITVAAAISGKPRKATPAMIKMSF